MLHTGADGASVGKVFVAQFYLLQVVMNALPHDILESIHKAAAKRDVRESARLELVSRGLRNATPRNRADKITSGPLLQVYPSDAMQISPLERTAIEQHIRFYEHIANYLQRRPSAADVVQYARSIWNDSVGGDRLSVHISPDEDVTVIQMSINHAEGIPFESALDFEIRHEKQGDVVTGFEVLRIQMGTAFAFLQADHFSDTWTRTFSTKKKRWLMEVEYGTAVSRRTTTDIVRLSHLLKTIPKFHRILPQEPHASFIRTVLDHHRY